MSKSFHKNKIPHIIENYPLMVLSTKLPNNLFGIFYEYIPGCTAQELVSRKQGINECLGYIEELKKSRNSQATLWALVEKFGV